MSKQDVNVEVDGVNEPLTGNNGDGMTKVQFTNNSDSVKFAGKPAPYVRSGLTKEELMKFANDPFWTRLRTILFFLFWVIWFAMLIGAIIIIIVAPKCPASSKLKWYQRASMCKIAKLNDEHSNHRNVTREKYIPLLEKLFAINFDTVILPPMQNISNFIDIDERYGTMGDFDEFIKKADKLNIIMEFDFIKTSVDHEWFKKSEKNEDGYSDMYIWKKNFNLPDISKSESSKWQYSTLKSDHYLTVDNKSAHLNLLSSDLQNIIKNTLSFWKDKGLRGYSLINVDSMIIQNVANKTDITPVIGELRNYIYTKVDPKGKTALMVEVADENNLDAFIGTEKINIADLVISKIDIKDRKYSGETFNKKIIDHFKVLPLWNSNAKIGPWTGVKFESSGENQNYIELTTMAYYMHMNVTPIPIIFDHIDNKSVEHFTILNKYRHEHIDSILMGEISYPLITPNIYSVIRAHPDNEGLLLIANFNDQTEKIKINATDLPDKFDILINSNSGHVNGTYLLSEGLPVKKDTASLFKYKPLHHN